MRDQQTQQEIDAEESEIRRLVRQAVRDACRGGANDRMQLARQIGVSEPLLNAYVSAGIELREKKNGERFKARKVSLPIRLLRRFWRATGSEKLHRFLLPEHLLLALEFGEIEIDQRQRLEKIAKWRKTKCRRSNGRKS